MASRYLKSFRVSLNNGESKQLPIGGNFIAIYKSTNLAVIILDNQSEFEISSGLSLNNEEAFRNIEIFAKFGSVDLTILAGFGNFSFVPADEINANISGTTADLSSETTLSLIEGKDFATETTLSSLEGKDFASESTLDQIRKNTKPWNYGSGPADLVVPANTQSLITPVSLTRYEMIMKSLGSNTDTFRIGSSNASASNGVELSPGEFFRVGGISTLYAYNTGSVSNTLSLLIVETQ